jgi:hypothetical protein
MSKISVIEGFIEPEDCQIAIDLINNSELVPFEGNPVANEAVRSPEIVKFLKKYTDKCIQKQTELYKLKVPIYTQSAYLTVWDVGAGAQLHIDHDMPFVQLTSVLYFNDEFEGGEIYFPEFDFSYKPKMGSAIFFPSFTKESPYEHGVTEITSGRRYTIGAWYTQFENSADKELL